MSLFIRWMGLRLGEWVRENPVPFLSACSLSTLFSGTLGLRYVEADKTYLSIWQHTLGLFCIAYFIIGWSCISAWLITPLLKRAYADWQEWKADHAED